MGALDVLARLAKQAVDRERQALQRINAATAEVEQRIEELHAMRTIEAAHGGDFMTVGATLPAYLQASRERGRAAAAKLRDQQAALAAQLKKLLQQRVELKRYEHLAERRAKRAAEDLAAKEQKVIDELVVITAGRHPRGQE